MKNSCRPQWFTVVIVGLFLGLSSIGLSSIGFSSIAFAEDVHLEDVEGKEQVEDRNEFADGAVDDATDDDQGLHHRSQLQIRATPIGLSLFSDTGYRASLWDSESDLLAGTYLDGGLTTALSPAFGWVGPYFEILPLAVLNLRVSAQFMGYFGNFGYLYVPGDEEREWGQDALDNAADNGLGQSATGMLLEARATPQMRVGRVVVTAETTFRYIQLDVDEPTYEPYFDLLFAPEDTFWVTRPTLGYLFGEDLSKGYFLLGARWERAVVNQTELVRDTVGLVFNWKIPSSLVEWGDPSVAGFGGVFVEHPNRGQISPYIGLQAVVEF